MKAITLQTERLTLERLLKTHQSQRYLGWMNDSMVYEFLESGGDYTLEDLNSYLHKVENSDIYFWAILKNEGNKHIGNIKIDPIDYKNKYGEYGIMIGDKTEWGKGFALEASQLVLEFCFQKLNLRKINLGVRSQNKAAIKLYERLGFKIEGRLKNHVVTQDGYDDVYRMAKFSNYLI